MAKKPKKAPEGSAKEPPALQTVRRVEYACDLLLAHHRKGLVVSKLCARYGVSPRTAEVYITRAKAAILAASAASRAGQVAESVDFYKSVIHSAAPLQQRIKARRLLDQLLGLAAPPEPPAPPPPQFDPDAQAAMVGGDPRILALALQIDALAAGPGTGGE